MNAISILEDPFYRNVAKSAGCSNIDTLSRDDKRAVQEALVQIQDILGSIRSSDEEYTPLTMLRDQLKVAIAPHKALPAEVLNAVFLALVPLSIEVDNRLDFDGKHEKPQAFDYLDITSWDLYGPRVVRGVCSFWRQIALKQQDLWSNIQIRWPHYPLTDPASSLTLQALVDKATTVLPETGPVKLRLVAPLSFISDIEPFDSPISSGHYSNVVSNLIFSLAGRLSALSYFGDLPELLLQLFHLPPSITFPNLRFITMVSRSLDSRRAGPIAGQSMRTVFCCSPNLQGIEVGIDDFEQYILPEPISWSQMRRLTLEAETPVKTILPIISSGVELRHLSLNLSPSGRDIIQNEIFLPHLKVLSLALIPGAEAILDALRLPAVCELEVSCDPIPSTEKIAALITRSECSIISFKDQWIPGIYDLDFIPLEPFHQLLALMPKLQSLRTGVAVNTALVHSIGSGSILPQLEAFECTSELDTSDFADALETGLESRDSNAPVRHCLHSITRMLDGYECEKSLMLYRMKKLKRDWGISFASVDLSGFDL